MNFKRFGRTANLFDKNATDTSKGYMSGYYLTSNGAVNAGTSAVPFSISEYIEIGNVPKITLTPLYTSGSYSPSICFYGTAKEYISGLQYQNTETVTFDVPNNATYFRFSIPMNNVNSVMVNSGSTALPYQPYKDWTNIPHYIHNTSTDTITTLPAVLYPNDTTATVGLKGDMSQTGTPSPTTPIQPSECGDMTGNLCNESDVVYDGTRDVSYMKTTPYHLLADETITVSLNYNATAMWLVNAANDIALSLVQNNNTLTYSRTSTLNVYVKLRFNNGTPSDLKVMLNTGSTPLPYEPYGVKIPILNNSQTYNKYLGEEQTVRQIQKVEFTGQENNWTYSAEYTRFTITIPNAYNTGVRTDETPCTHYVSIHDGRPIGDVPNNSVYTAPSVGLVYLSIKDTAYTTLETWKQFLADEYAAGTPVCVWYVLATPETAVVNEPLRKIGDYADEVSGITIPTTAGANTLSVGTTLQPSEVTVNYKGWHPVADVHEKSRNLLNEAEPPQNIYITDSIRRMGYEVEVTAGTYTAYGDNSDLYAKTKINGIYGDAVQINNSQNLTLNSDGIIIIYSRVNGEFPDVNIMLNTGSQPLPYEPYWT